MAKDALTGQIMDKASSFLGEDSANLTKGFGAAIPSILGSIVGKSSSTGGAGQLLGMLKEGGFDGGMMDNLGDLFGGGAATSGALDAGGGLLKHFLGDKVGGVADIISKVSGIGSGSSNKILSLAAPMIMNMIGRVVKNKALDAVGLGSLLGSQKGFLANALPSGVGSLLGLGSMLTGAKDNVSAAVGAASSAATSAASAATNTAQAATAKASGGIGKWLLPLAVVLLAAWGIKTYGCAEKAGDAMSSVADAAKDGMDKAGDMAGAAASGIADAATGLSDAAVEAANKALEGIKFAAGSVGDEFSKFLASGADGDKTFKFSNLTFASGSGNIEGETGVEVDNLAAVLNAYPSVAIEINGYTDSQGNDDNNQALSELRANTVMQKLIANGVDATRLTAVGHGEANPVGDNATAEGRAMNRRIEVKITSK